MSRYDQIKETCRLIMALNGEDSEFYLMYNSCPDAIKDIIILKVVSIVQDNENLKQALYSRDYVKIHLLVDGAIEQQDDLPVAFTHELRKELDDRFHNGDVKLREIFRGLCLRMYKLVNLP